MSEASRDLVRRLRNTPVRILIKALERDGFTLKRATASGARIYSHRDGRLTVIHYHKGSDTLPRKTLASVLAAVRWTETDLRRLKLISDQDQLVVRARRPLADGTRRQHGGGSVITLSCRS